MPRHSSVKLGFIGIALAGACAAGCGGGGGGSTGVQPPPPAAPNRITFSSRNRAVLSSGEAVFALAQPIASGEQAVCSIDGAAAPCALSSAGGSIRYEDLAAGLHRFAVELRSTGSGASSARAEHVVEMLTPAVVVYAATPGGITAAIAAAESGQTAAIIEPSPWIGGMMSGGLAKTDVGTRGAEIVGGLTLEFFQRMRARLQVKGACIPAECRSGFDLEPGEAEALLEEMLLEAGVIVERSAALQSVEKSGDRVQSITTSRGTVSGKVFVDASYEGDFLARAGITHTLGREPRTGATAPADPALAALHEEHAGTLLRRAPLGLFVDPYVVPGDPASGTVPYVEPRPPLLPAEGAGDARVMAYTYRLCVTDDPGNRIPFTAPAGYSPANYEASARVAVALAATGVDLGVRMFNPAPVALSTNRAHFKYDLNGGSTFSIDMTGPDLNQAYITAGEAERERIREAYRTYIRGLLYFWQTDPRFEGLNAKIARFGYCQDEFTDRGGWPHQLYVRVGRRMVGDFVMNENDVLQNGRRPAPADVIGFGAYNSDMHTFRYLAAPLNWPDGIRRDALTLEGFQIIRLPADAPYPIPYRVLLPKAADAANVLAVVPLSATHVAYASLRMEPTFMILGESAGVAAAIAAGSDQSVQSIDYGTLRQHLLQRGQRLVN